MLGYVVKCKLHTFELRPEKVVRALFKILNRAGASQSDVTNSALKVVAVFLRYAFVHHIEALCISINK